MLNGTIVGFGRMGITHHSILNTHPKVRLVGVCDPSSFIRTNVERHLNTRAFAGFGKVIEEEDLDFVIIASPTGTHSPMVRLALESNLHVFVEKPFSLDPNEGEELVSIAYDRGLVNQVGYVIRFNDIIIQVKALLEGRALGRVHTFKIEMNGPTVIQRVKSGWRSEKKEGGGCLYDFASHSIDLSNYLFGEPKTVTGSVLQRIHSENAEDAVCATFLYADNKRGTLLVNWSDPSYRKPTYRVEILCEKGKMIADLHELKVFFREEPCLAGYSTGWNRRYVTELADSARFYVRGFEFTRQLDHFVDKIAQGDPQTWCTFEDALRTDMIIKRIADDAEGR